MIVWGTIPPDQVESSVRKADDDIEGLHQAVGKGEILKVDNQRWKVYNELSLGEGTKALRKDTK